MGICTIILNITDLTGELEDRHFIVTRGDTRLTVTMARNSETAKLRRSTRFLIDDPEADLMLAYVLTKPYKLFNVYENKGVYKFVLQEVNTTEFDDQENGIADYFRYHPQDSDNPITQDWNVDPEQNETDDGRSVWL